MAPQHGRSLPLRTNHLMVQDIHNSLVKRRRLGQTKLTPKMVAGDDVEPGTLGVFDYAYLRAPLPKGIVSGIFKSSPNSYFLMRRSFDGYISATGMFKATFPYAEAIEEEEERKYIKSLPTTSPEETAGNIWIPPEAALLLAEEYNITLWIRALLDPSKVIVSSAADSPAKTILAPPKFDLSKTHQPSWSSRANGSASPIKPRGPVTPRKQISVINNQIETVEANLNITENDKEEGIMMIQSASFEPDIKLEPRGDAKISVQIGEHASSIGNNPGTEVDPAMHSSGQPPTHQEIAEMMQSAKDMVELNRQERIKRVSGDHNGSRQFVTADKVVPPAIKKSKRKAIDMSVSETADDVERVGGNHPHKKLKSDMEVRKRRVKTRALFGVGATVAVG